VIPWPQLVEKSADFAGMFDPRMALCQPGSRGPAAPRSAARVIAEQESALLLTLVAVNP
jgi:hypothetical protein